MIFLFVFTFVGVLEDSQQFGAMSIQLFGIKLYRSGYRTPPTFECKKQTHKTAISNTQHYGKTYLNIYEIFVQHLVNKIFGKNLWRKIIANETK